MRSLKASLPLWVALLTVTVIGQWPRPACAIVGGQLDGIGHPNVGTFVVPKGLDLDGDGQPDVDANGDGVPDVPFITGSWTLIHPRVALTAGHNTERILADLAAGVITLNDLKVSLSPNPALDPKSWLDVSAVHIHPDYNPNWNIGWGATPLADLGVVILKRPVKSITPVTLPPEGLLDALEAAGELREGPDGTRFTVVGYGSYGVGPNQLLPADGQRRVAQSEFLLLLDRWLFLDQNAAHGNGGTAAGDSGGPTFWVDPGTGEEILVSVTSRGDAAVASTGITYRTDTAEALEFIESVIAALGR